jgi:hypothetical protein
VVEAQPQQGVSTPNLAFRAAAKGRAPPHPTQAMWAGAFARAPQPFWPPPSPLSEHDLSVEGEE